MPVCDPRLILWPASFRGARFLVLNDDEGGGRRLVVHEFPGRDEPFNEDLGAKARTFDVTAYLASENSAGEAAALTAAIDRRGAGLLVLPTHGPVLARGHDFKRSRDRDRLGYIAYSLSFVREGHASALVSAASLANLIFVAADRVQAAIGPAFAAALVSTRSALGAVGFVPDYVRDAAIDGYVSVVAALDAVRADLPLDPAMSLALGSVLDGLAASAQRIEQDPANAAEQVVGTARAIGDGLAPDFAAPAFLALADASPSSSLPETASVNRRRATANRSLTARLLRIAALTVHAEALARRSYASRADGVTARADAAEYLDAELEACSGAGDAELFDALEALRNAVADHLSRTIATLAPVVTVESPLRLPAIVLAYRLYGDPDRAEELVARNAARVPSRMPLIIEALKF